jgi:hypothetical protein
VPRHGDDALGAHPGGRQNAEQPHGPVAHDGDRVALADVRRDRGVPTGTHHVGEREQARDHRGVGLVAQRDEGAVGERDADELRLRRAEGEPGAVLRPEVRDVVARRLHADLAVRAGVVADREGADDEVTGAQAAHVGADLLDDADQLVADGAGLGDLVDAPVGPQVGAAYAGRDDADDCVRRGQNRGVGDVVEADVAGGVQDGRLHGVILPPRRPRPSGGAKGQAVRWPCSGGSAQVTLVVLGGSAQSDGSDGAQAHLRANASANSWRANISRASSCERGCDNERRCVGPWISPRGVVGAAVDARGVVGPVRMVLIGFSGW